MALLETDPLVITWIDTRLYKNVLADKYLSVSAVNGRSSALTFKNLPYPVGTDLILQKSSTPLSGWKTLAKITVGTAAYLDESANNTFSRHDLEYYRLVCPTYKSTIGTVSIDGYPDAYGAEIARRHRIQLVNGLGGNKSYLYKRMHTGTRCPDCWDDILKKRSKVNCTTCNSTGFVQGFYNPIEAYISFGEEGVSVINSIDGPATAPNAVRCWCSNYPMLAVGDLVIEPGSNRAWSVANIELTMNKRVVTKQSFTLQKEDGDDPFYAIIGLMPSQNKGGTQYGKSILQNDAENSAGVCFSGSTKIL